MEGPRPPSKELLLELGAFALVVTSVCSLWRNNLLLTVVALTECALALTLWHDRLSLSFFGVIGGLGTLAEAVFVRFGVWRYANPSFLGIPLWFPIAFGATGLIGSRLARTVVALWEKWAPPPAQRP